MGRRRRRRRPNRAAGAPARARGPGRRPATPSFRPPASRLTSPRPPAPHALPSSTARCTARRRWSCAPPKSMAAASRAAPSEVRAPAWRPPASCGGPPPGRRARGAPVLRARLGRRPRRLWELRQAPPPCMRPHPFCREAPAANCAPPAARAAASRRRGNGRLSIPTPNPSACVCVSSAPLDLHLPAGGFNRRASPYIGTPHPSSFPQRAPCRPPLPTLPLTSARRTAGLLPICRPRRWGRGRGARRHRKRRGAARSEQQPRGTRVRVARA
jgi:hypothetical protein